LVWRQLRHPNVLLFVGLNQELFPQDPLPSLLSPWMEHGRLEDFISGQDRTELTTHKLVRLLLDMSTLRFDIAMSRCWV
jgi:hypothetical protein